MLVDFDSIQLEDGLTSKSSDAESSPFSMAY